MSEDQAAARESTADVARDAFIRNAVGAGTFLIVSVALIALQHPRYTLWARDQWARARRRLSHDPERERIDREVARFRRDIGDIARNLHREAP